MKKATLFLILQIFTISLFAQINTDRVLAIGRNALYFEDYVLSIQYFNQVIKSKPWLAFYVACCGGVLVFNSLTLRPISWGVCEPKSRIISFSCMQL